MARMPEPRFDINNSLPLRPTVVLADISTTIVSDRVFDPSGISGIICIF